MRHGRGSSLSKGEADVLRAIQALEQNPEVSTADVARYLARPLKGVSDNLEDLKARLRIDERRSPDGLQRFWIRK